MPQYPSAPAAIAASPVAGNGAGAMQVLRVYVMLPSRVEVWHRTDSGGWVVSKYGLHPFDEYMKKRETFEPGW